MKPEERREQRFQLLDDHIGRALHARVATLRQQLALRFEKLRPSGNV